VSSDHGEEFGEHAKYEHGNDVFMTQVHVPLIISFPKQVPSGVRIASPVGLRDLAATVLDMTGVADSTALPGRSLAALWSLPNPGRVENPLSVLEKTNEFHASLVTPTHHYIYANGTEYLFDYRSDPDERRDLARAPWAPDTLRSLRRELIMRLASDAPAKLRALQTH
jgi:arylsulfatase A-like enzyme